MVTIRTLTELIDDYGLEFAKALVKKWRSGLRRVKMERTGRVRIEDKFGRKSQLSIYEVKEFLRWAAGKIEELWEDPLFPVVRDLGREKVEDLGRIWRHDPELTVTPLGVVHISDRPARPFLSREEKISFVAWMIEKDYYDDIPF